MFEIIDHTADAGVVARGATLAETFAEAARGMYSLMVDLAAVRERESRDVAVEAGDEKALLVAWLLELNFLTETAGLVFSRFEVDEPAHGRLHARAFGERLDPARHDPGVAIKGVTRHMLEVAREDRGWRARVIFDI